MSDLLTEEPSATMRAGDIRAALRDRLPVTEYALLFEVSNTTGFSRSRSADAIAMSLWPSRGLEVFGFEIKVARNDWLRELKDPAKAEPIAQYCDRWVVLAAPGIVKVEEVPPGWGLWELSPERTKWRALIAPPKLNAVPLDRGFVASVLRRASSGDDDMVQASVRKLREQDETQFERRVAQRVESRTKDHKRLTEYVAAFEKAAGITIGDWRAGDVGAAVQIVLAQKDYGVLENARRLRDKLDELLAATTFSNLSAEERR